MNPSRRGDETEAVLLQRLLSSGVSVSVPFGDSDRYDLIVDERGELYRVQCKTGNWVNGTVRFNLYTSTVDGGERVDRDYTEGEVDAYAVYSPDTAAAYWVPIGDTGTGEMRLRVEDPHPNAPASAINWAADYALSDRFG
ncbi:group I intron-associated PD-(D/E)XK endonuclease [Halostella litorea]|uniref:group I intron-associated PD-(D/E)XK endonuclease n=1 Tax=Halostella litorea TaxID=2528831 RepID=UPI001091DFC6|nr:group I intron-associated PD-(D/E)XK endonuclease [Halostella litorea]